MQRAHRAHHHLGQALVEFALLLPVLLLTLFVFVDLLLAAQTQATLGSVADALAHTAALAGGETAAVDAQVVRLAGQNGLDVGRLQVRLDTDAGSGTWHDATRADLPAGMDRTAWYPPPAAYNGEVIVHLRYAYSLALPLVGPRTWTIAVDASAASQVDTGVLAQ